MASSDALGVFEVALTGDDERRIAKVAQDEKIAAAVYDVKQNLGHWLFHANDTDAFNDRFAMQYNDIARTVEPHIHAGRGVMSRVSKTLYREWKQRLADSGVSGYDDAMGSMGAGTGGMGAPKPPSDPTGGLMGPSGEVTGTPFKPSMTNFTGPGGPQVPGQVGTGTGYVARRRQAEFEDQPDHPEQNIKKTFQDHQGEELIPEGDFHAYEDRVDQGGPSKVENHAFVPGEHTDRHDADPDSNFVHGSREFQLLARALYADDMGAGGGAPMAPPPSGMDPNAGAPAPGGAPPPAPMGGGTPPAPMTTTPPAGSPAAAPPPPGGPPPVTASREFREMQAMLRKSSILTTASANHVAQRIQASVPVKLVIAAALNGRHAMVRIADRNYLQQADEAITKVLNEKAEEFQNTIAPLQQALITIQQAEQLQGPLNVQPPAGTVNVLPGGAQGNPDPAAGGQAPPPQQGADPAAAALAGAAAPPAAGQQVAARRRQAGAHDFSPEHYQAIDDEAQEFGDPGPVRAKTPPNHYPNWDGPRGAMEQEFGEAGPGRHRASGYYDDSGDHDPDGGGGYAVPDSPEHSRHQSPDWESQGMGAGEWNDAGRPGWKTNNPGRKASRGRRPFVRSAAEQCEYCGGHGHDHTAHPEAMADMRDWDRERSRQEFPFGDHHESSRRDGAAIEQEYENFLKKQPGLPSSGGVGLNEFVQQKKVGPRAVNKLKQKQGLPADMPMAAQTPMASNSGGKRQKRHTSGVEFTDPGYTWSKAPASVRAEFGGRVASGVDPERAFREMIAEITQHHEAGAIGSHDAHRAANEALGRLMLSRKQRAAGSRRPLG